MKKINYKNINTGGINRRKFLYNTAGGIASAATASSFSQRALADENVKRLIVWYVPEGCAQQAFWPVNTGNIVINPDAGFDDNKLTPNPGGRKGQGQGNPSNHWENKSGKMASYCLQPFMGMENDFSMYSGFQNYGGDEKNTSDDHVRAISGALTGGTVKGGSVDRVVGREIQGSSAFEAAYFSVYGAFVNGQGTADYFLSPVRTIGGGYTGSPIWNPVEVFNTLGIAAGVDDSQYVQLNALKAVEKRIKEIQCAGGEEARTKLESLLEVYQRVAQSTQSLIGQNDAGGSVRVAIPDGWADPDNIVNDRRDGSHYWNNSDNFTKMLDIAIDSTVAAFALDRTRVSTIQCCGTGQDSGSLDKNHYRKLDLWAGQGRQEFEGNTDLNDHYMSHNGQDITKRNQARIFQWYYSKLARLVQKLKDTPDGTGSLFDNTMIVACSEFGGRDHHHHDTPFMVFGGDNIDFRKGQYIDSYDRNAKTHLDSASFLHGVTKTMGLNIDKFGRSTSAFTL